MTSEFSPPPRPSELKIRASIVAFFVAVFWAVESVDFLFGGRLDALGVWPRSAWGLPGILLMPFLHGGFLHLISNTVPFIILSGLVLLGKRVDFFKVTGVVMLVSGLGVWLFGVGNTVTIGSSGLIFGYFGYLIFRGFFERSFFSIMIAGVVMFLYGGLIFGVLPLQREVSWQAHLFGFIGGGMAARMLTPRRLKA